MKMNVLISVEFKRILRTYRFLISIVAILLIGVIHPVLVLLKPLETVLLSTALISVFTLSTQFLPFPVIALVSPSISSDKEKGVIRFFEVNMTSEIEILASRLMFYFTLTSVLSLISLGIGMTHILFVKRVVYNVMFIDVCHLIMFYVLIVFGIVAMSLAASYIASRMATGILLAILFWLITMVLNTTHPTPWEGWICPWHPYSWVHSISLRLLTGSSTHPFQQLTGRPSLWEIILAYGQTLLFALFWIFIMISVYVYKRIK